MSKQRTNKHKARKQELDKLFGGVHKYVCTKCGKMIEKDALKSVKVNLYSTVDCFDCGLEMRRLK